MVESPDHPAERLHRRQAQHLAGLLAGAALIYAVGHFVWLVTDYDNVFVHPDFYGHIVQETVVNGLRIQWSDALYALQIRSPGEFRPRFLAYGIAALDQKIRLFLYDFFLVPPTFLLIAWTLQLAVAPWCLFRLMDELTKNRRAATCAVAVYLTSVGFLSGFSMSLLQGKALSHVVFIVVLYVMARLEREARPGLLLYQIPSRTTYAVLGILLAGLFLDEMPLFAFPLVAVLFHGRFLPPTVRRQDIRRVVLNLAFFSLPLLIFLAVVLIVIPPITKKYFGVPFDYLGNALAIGTHTFGARSMLTGPYSTFGPGTVAANFVTLFGVSLVPWQLSPFVTSPFGAYPGTQVTNWPKIVIFAAVFGGLAVTAVRSAAPAVKYLRRTILAIALFLIFYSLVAIRHIPVSTGYYYGSAFAALLALLMSSWYAASEGWREHVAPALAGLVAVIALVQTTNFAPINRGWLYTHHELIARQRYQDKFKLAPARPLRAAELAAIHRAWKHRQLPVYLAQHQLSVGAIYLVVELQTIDRVRAAAARARLNRSTRHRS
jgi:hypothetical protein